MTLFIVRPDNNVMEAVQEHLANLNHTKEWSIEIKLNPKNRTIAQNSYLHMLCAIVAEHTGHETEEVKHMQVEAVNGYNYFMTATGEVGKTLPSTAKMKVKELAKLIEATQVLCSSLGLIYPDPSLYGYKI